MLEPNLSIDRDYRSIVQLLEITQCKQRSQVLSNEWQHNHKSNLPLCVKMAQNPTTLLIFLGCVNTCFIAQWRYESVSNWYQWTISISDLNSFWLSWWLAVIMVFLFVQEMSCSQGSLGNANGVIMSLEGSWSLLRLHTIIRNLPRLLPRTPLRGILHLKWVWMSFFLVQKQTTCTGLLLWPWRWRSPIFN